MAFNYLTRKTREYNFVTTSEGKNYFAYVKELEQIFLGERESLSIAFRHIKHLRDNRVLTAEVTDPKILEDIALTWQESDFEKQGKYLVRHKTSLG